MEHTNQQTASDSNQLSLLQDLASCDTNQTELPTSHHNAALAPYLYASSSSYPGSNTPAPNPANHGAHQNAKTNSSLPFAQANSYSKSSPGSDRSFVHGNEPTDAERKREQASPSDLQQSVFSNILAPKFELPSLCWVPSADYRPGVQASLFQPDCASHTSEWGPLPGQDSYWTLANWSPPLQPKETIQLASTFPSVTTSLWGDSNASQNYPHASVTLDTEAPEGVPSQQGLDVLVQGPETQTSTTITSQQQAPYTFYQVMQQQQPGSHVQSHTGSVSIPQISQAWSPCPYPSSNLTLPLDAFATALAEGGEPSASPMPFVSQPGHSSGVKHPMLTGQIPHSLTEMNGRSIWEIDNVDQMPNPEHCSNTPLPNTNLASDISLDFRLYAPKPHRRTHSAPSRRLGSVNRFLDLPLHTLPEGHDNRADSAAFPTFWPFNDDLGRVPGNIGPHRHNLKFTNGSQGFGYRRGPSDGRTTHGLSPYLPLPQVIPHVNVGGLPDVSGQRGEYSECHGSGIPLNAQRRPTESESNFQCPVLGCGISLNRRLNLTEHLVRFHSNSVGVTGSNLGLDTNESEASLSSHGLAVSSARDSSIMTCLQEWLKVLDCTQLHDFLYLERKLTSLLEHKALDAIRPMHSDFTLTELASLVDLLYKMLQPGNTLKDERRIDRLLTRVVKVTGLLPSSITINDVMRHGSNPVAGGGFADVWRGKQGDIDVAMKVLRIFGEGELSKRVLRAFCSEVLVWHRLRHSNVMPFLGVCKTEFAPRYALISPWMKNGHMLEYLEKHPLSNRRGMMLGVAMGMEYLHTMKPTVIHGDLRAPNILIDDNGQPRISDFGLAIFFDSKGGSLTQSSFRGQGSVWWQAPELLNPTKFSGIKLGLTTNSDVYAFACVCLEIFTEKAPFSNLTDLQVIMEVAVNDGRPPRPPQPAEERGLSDEVWSLIQDCWAAQPADRPSMTAVRAHIENITANQRPVKL